MPGAWCCQPGSWVWNKHCKRAKQRYMAFLWAGLSSHRASLSSNSWPSVIKFYLGSFLSFRCSPGLQLRGLTKLPAAHPSSWIQWPLLILYHLSSFQSRWCHFFFLNFVGSLHIHFQSTPLEKSHTTNLFKKSPFLFRNIFGATRRQHPMVVRFLSIWKNL